MQKKWRRCDSVHKKNLRWGEDRAAQTFLVSSRAWWDPHFETCVETLATKIYIRKEIMQYKSISSRYLKYYPLKM
jgi:hypothetical protein